MSAKLDRLLPTLNTSGIQIQNPPLYQVIKDLIEEARKLEKALAAASGGGSTNITNIQQIYQILNGDSGGGEGDNVIVPGPAGAKGADGAPGAQGPPFPAFIVLDPEQGEDILPLPGPQGIQGVKGDTGATGASLPFAIITNEENYDDSVTILPNPQQGWSYITSRAMSGNATEDFTGLSGYSEICVLCKGVTLSSTAIIALRVSTDNGGTFLSASGDYIALSGVGAETNRTLAQFNGANNTSARTCYMVIRAFNTNAPFKPVDNIFFSTDSVGFGLINNANPFSAVRILNTGAGNMNGGTVYIYGRN